MPAEVREDARVSLCTLAMAALATAALEQAVLEPGHSRGLALAFTLGVLVAPALAAAWYVAGRGGSTVTGRSGPALFAALLALFALPFACAGARLVLTGRCAMPEVTLLAALRNLGLGLAATADRPVYARLSALVSLFLVTVALPLGGDAGAAVLAPVGGFAVAGTLWLMLVYWNGLGPVVGPGYTARRFALSGAAWMLGVVMILAAITTVGPSRAATALAGLMPTSGGTDWSDPDARSGVGDGDNEVSASEHPQSVGFTESEVYLETDRPSLWATRPNEVVRRRAVQARRRNRRR